MTEKNQQNRGVEKTVRDIRRVTRRQYSAEEKCSGLIIPDTN